MTTKANAIIRSVFNTRLTAGLLLAILTAGMVSGWWMVERTNDELRASQLLQARMVAQTINLDRLKALTGTDADTNSPVYLRLKEQLATVRTAIPQCRFVYLMGQRPNGNLFFFVDSEPTNSKGCSPAGQVYTEAPKSFHRVFGTRNAATEGSYTDRWGNWISALVPIMDPQTIMEGMASPKDAKAMVIKAVDFYRKNGRERFLNEVNNPKGEFRKGDLYAFVYDRNMTYLAHPVNPERVGQNCFDKKDWIGGRCYRREIQKVAQSQGHGWVEYEYENAASKQLDHKTTYFESADDLIVCAGAYRGDGKVLAALGLDVDANAYDWKLLRAALPPAVLSLTLAAIVLIGSTLLALRSRMSVMPTWWRQHIEAALVASTGLALSLFAGWMVQQRDIHDRNDAFTQLAENQSQDIAEKLRELRNIGLESLAHFYEHSSSVTLNEFELFTPYLTRNPTVQAWAWIPVVSAADKTRFEASARADGLKGYEIWQEDAQGKRIPATERAVYYPVFHLAPLVGNERALGYDLGSEPLRRAALETVTRTGLSTATDPISLVQEAGSQKGMLVFRPVFDRENPKRLRGIALILLRMKTVLRDIEANNSVFIELALRRKDGTLESLSTTWQADSPPLTGISLTRPVMAFGKVFSVTAYAGPEFMRLHPVRDGWLVSLTGLVATSSLAILIGVFHRRREQLERLVVDRTSELRDSEIRYRSLLNDMLEGFAYCRMVFDDRTRPVDFIYLNVNSAFERLTGLHNVVGKPVTEVVPNIKETNPEVFEIYGRVVLTGASEQFEIHIKNPQQWFNISVTKSGNGCFATIFQNITARKQAEAALQQAARASELLSQCILAINACLDFNSAMGCLLKKVIGLDSIDGGALYLIEGQDAVLRHQAGLEPEFVDQVARRPLSTGYMKAALENPHDIINVIKRFPEQNQLGEAHGLRHVHCIALMAGQQPLGFLNVFSRRVEPPSTADIEFIRILALEAGSVFLHFRIEDRLLHLNAEMRVILDTTPLGVSYVKDRKVQWVNPAFAHILGYTVEESVGLDSAAFYVSREEYERAGRGAYEQISKGESYSFEVRFKRKDGSLFWADLVGKCVNPTNLAAGSIWTLHDTTERKGMLEAIQESELRLRSILMAMTEGVIVRTAEGTVIDCNLNAEKILGMSRNEIMGLTSIPPRWQAVHQDGSTFPSEDHPALVSLRMGRACHDMQMGFHLPDGSKRWININAEPMVRKGETQPYAVVTSFADITERKQTEVALQQSARASELLRQCILAINACSDFNSAMWCLLQKVIDLDTIDGGGLYLIEGQDAVLRHQIGIEPEFVDQVARRPLSTGYMKVALENPQEIINVMERFPEQNQLGEAHGLRHVHCITLMAGQQPLGFLSVFSRQVQPPTGADIEFIRILSLEAGSVFLHFRIEDRLLHLNAEMRVILDTTPLGVCHIKDRKVQWVNPAFGLILGYTEEESVGLDSAAF